MNVSKRAFLLMIKNGDNYKSSCNVLKDSIPYFLLYGDSEELIP